MNPSSTHERAIAAARIAGVVLREHAEQIDETAVFPAESIAAVKRSGLMGLMVPGDLGGWGASFSTLTEVGQILASNCLSTALIWGMHCQQVVTIADHAEASLRRAILGSVAEEARLILSVTSEREKGGHLMSAHAPLQRESDQLLLDRDAPVVSGGDRGDGYLITMRSSTDSATSEVSLVYADRSQLELSPHTTWNTLGVRGTHSIGMRIKGRVPQNQMIVEPSKFKSLATSTFVPAGHLAWASAWLGSAREALRRLVALIRDPAARGTFDLQSELLSERIARARLNLDLVASYLAVTAQQFDQARAAAAADRTQPSAAFLIQINGVKIAASELLFDTVHRLLQMAGLKHGYTRGTNLGLERTFRDLRSAAVMYSNDRLLVAIGKLALLDPEVQLPALPMNSRREGQL
jgi:acyl-CoA dehydrogenase